MPSFDRLLFLHYAWPPAWDSVLLRFGVIGGLSGALVFVLMGLLAFPESSKELMPDPLPNSVIAEKMDLTKAFQAVPLTFNVFDASHVFPEEEKVVSKEAPSHIPKDWNTLEAMSDPNVQVFGIMQRGGHWRVLTGSDAEQQWLEVGEEQASWNLAAVRAEEVVWKKGREFRHGLLIEPGKPKNGRPTVKSSLFDKAKAAAVAQAKGAPPAKKQTTNHNDVKRTPGRPMPRNRSANTNRLREQTRR